MQNIRIDFVSSKSQRALESDEREILKALSEPIDNAAVADRCWIEIDPGRSTEEGDWEPTVVTLVPSNPNAARLGIQLDHDAQITFYLGRHATVAEDFNRDRAQLVDGVRDFGWVVIHGEYREYVRVSSEGHHRKSIGRVRWPNGKTNRLSYNVLLPHRWSSLARKGWGCEEYEPY